VPYEGRKKRSADGRHPSRRNRREVVLYRIEKNRPWRLKARDRLQPRSSNSSGGSRLQQPGRARVRRPGRFRLAARREVLLDEKLGLHIAFGRSEHFGGIVGPKDFSSPSAVIHLDRIYIPETQPRVAVAEAVLAYPRAGRNRDEGRPFTIF